MDGCVSVSEERGIQGERERERCEGTIKALYYKSLTVHVCVEITEGCLSPFWLCQNDVCIPFFLLVKYYSGVAGVCVISASMWPTCLIIPHVLSALTWGIAGGRLVASWEERQNDLQTHSHTCRWPENRRNARKAGTRQKRATADSDSSLDQGLRAWQLWLIT